MEFIDVLAVFYHTSLLNLCFLWSCFSAAPNAPGKPEAVDWSARHVDLKWTAPTKDGGSPITGIS